MSCGEPLSYHEKAEDLKCIYCGRTEPGHISCPKGHYICDLCHNKDAMKVIEDIVYTTESKDPFEIAELAMCHPGVPMLGCQHAYIAGGALMSAIKNKGSHDRTNADIKEVFKRTEKQAHGGYCGLTGVCGIAPAIGAVFSVLTGSKCGKDEEQMVTMEAVTRVSREITNLTGPSCCKAYVWASLETAVDYINENLGIELPARKTAVCVYSHKHPHGCRETSCPYYPEEVSTAGAMTGAGDNLLSNNTNSQQIKGNNISEDKEDKMEELLNKALELGAEKAKSIDPATVVVEEWVRWKCQFGCPLYDKDGSHPPCAPDAASTKKVLKEYGKVILMNGPKGKALTEAVVRLEGEAYNMGYYKAFALTSLSSGPAGAA